MTKVETSKLGATNKSPGAPIATSQATNPSSTASANELNTASVEKMDTTSNASSSEQDNSKSTTSSNSTSETSTAPLANDSACKQNQSESSNSNSVTSKQDSSVTLTTVELQVLSELDSTQFGFVRLNEEVNSRKKSLVLKAIKYLERFIVRSRERQRRADAEPNNNGKNRPNDVSPTLYCKLGHLHLLLENFSKALSAYQMFFKLRKGMILKTAKFFID